MDKTDLGGGGVHGILTPGRAADEQDAAGIGGDLEKEHFLLDFKVNWY